MANVHVGKLVEILNKEHTVQEKVRAYRRQLVSNMVLETKCILACEVGEFVGDNISFFGALSMQNLIGWISGVATGASYAYAHVLKDARKEDCHASKKEALMYACSTEFGCVVGATSTEALGMQLTNVSNNPFSAESMKMRLLMLPAAWIVGLGIMSIFTYGKGSEVTRFITNEGWVNPVYDHMRGSGGDVMMKNNKIRVRGRKSVLVIGEAKQDDHERHAGGVGVVVKSPVARYDHEGKEVLATEVHSLFGECGFEVRTRGDIYGCQGEKC